LVRHGKACFHSRTIKGLEHLKQIQEAADNFSNPDVIAQEIVDDLASALKQFWLITKCLIRQASQDDTPSAREIVAIDPAIQRRADQRVRDHLRPEPAITEV